MFKKLCFLMSFVLVLSLAATSYGLADPCVIGNWEGILDGWTVIPPATSTYDTIGATLDDFSLEVYNPVSGPQEVLTIDLNAPDVNMVQEFFERASFAVDVTRMAEEWAGDPCDPCDGQAGVDFILRAGSNLGDVCEVLGGRLYWRPGDGNSTKMAAWDYYDFKEFIDQNSVTYLTLTIVMDYDPNYDNPGKYYFDNAQLLPYALRLDFNNTGESGPGETEGGFTSFTLEDSGSKVGGIMVTLSGSLQSRRRDVPSGIAFEQVFRDFIFGSNSDMMITLMGFGANQECEVTVWTYDDYSLPVRIADWTANGEYIFTTAFDGNEVDPNWPRPTGPDDPCYFRTAMVNADDVGTLVFEVTANENHPGDHWAFCNAMVVLPTSEPIPVTSAYYPVPANEQTGVTIETNLSWSPGAKAEDHDLYFGTSWEDVNNRSGGVYVGRQSGVGYPLTGLDLHTTYYWCVDEVNLPLIWKGHIWEFTITDYISIDDFEDYLFSEPAGSAACPYYSPDDLRWVWLDGHVQKNPQGDCGGGMDDYSPLALEGSMGRLPGSRIIRTNDGWTGYGLSYYYDNDDVDNSQFPPEQDSYEDFYSEIIRYYPEGRNLLTANGKVSEGTCPAIEVSYIGNPANSNDPVYDRMYIVLEDMDQSTSMPYMGDSAQIDNPDVDAAQVINWTQWPIELSDFTDINPDLDLTRIRSIRIGFGERFNPFDGTPGGEGTVVFDNIRLYGPHCVLSERSAGIADADFGPPGNPPGDCVIDYEEIAVIGDDWLSGDDIIETNDPAINGGLVAYWPMNEGDGDEAEDIVGDHNGTFSAAGVSWVSPGVNGGTAIHVDGGAGSRIEIPAWQPFAPDGHITIACWVRWAGSNARSEGLVCQRNGWEADLVRFMFELDTPGSNGALQMRQYDGNYDVSTAQGAMNPFIGRWAHVAVTYDGNDATFYINGQNSGGGAYSPGGAADPNMGMTIGNTNTEAAWNNCPESLNGDIDEVRIYNRALSAGEIAYLADLLTDQGDGELYVEVPSNAELYDSEAQGERIINFYDYALLVQSWLEEELWP